MGSRSGRGTGSRGGPGFLALSALAVALLAAPGCVTRTLAVTSDPPGARVILDGHYVGMTPWEQRLESYGTRALVLELEGHATRHEQLDVPMPWWQVFPLDIVTDLLLPLGLHDDHRFHFVLAPRDPEAGSWDEARAAYAREREARAELLRATGGAEGDAP
jgi:hypothetical protein